MATAVLLKNVVRQLRAAGRTGECDELSDALLLERFIGRQDEAAFAVLLHRHGPMVFGVCRHTLHNPQDVEDAFQAAFLVFVRRASSIRKHGSLASWLYGVALRTARRAQLDAARRQRRECCAASEPIQIATDEMTWREVRAVLHEEIDRLPEKYRAPLVLCYLEGLTNARAARQLGVPAGSLSKRLGRARGLLRGRLLRRGVALPGGALLALPLGQASAAVPPALTRATTRAAGQALVGAATSSTATVLAGEVARALAAGKVMNLCAWVLALSAALVGGSWLAAGRGAAEALRGEAPARRVAASALPEADEEQHPARPDLVEVRRLLLLRNGGTEATEKAVSAGLAWLATQQKADGRWAIEGGQVNDTAATAFGLLPFLGAGLAHQGPLGKEPYAAKLQKGLDFLVSHQAASGDLGGGMYGHALGTMTLCQAYALTADPKLKEPAGKAVAYIVAAQYAAGGWRYAPGQPGDTSVTAWQVAALHAARQAGLAVPAKTLDLTQSFLNSCQSADGGYGYVMPNATATMTAAGLLSRLRLGWGPHVADFRHGVVALTKLLAVGGAKSYYGAFWTTPVFQRTGGEEWDKFNAQMREQLLDAQEQDKDQTRPQHKGSWVPQNVQFDSAGGRLMVTSLAVMTLEVYYRDELPLALAPPRVLTKDEVSKTWDSLSASDDLTSRRAVWTLARASEQTLPFLKQQLPPRPPEGVDRQLVAQRIADLDNENFDKREQASADLEKMGASIAVLLRDARSRVKSAEVRRRLGELLAKCERPNTVSETVRLARAVRALEYAGTPEAKQFLRELADKDPQGDLGREAKAALSRLNARPGK